MTVVKQIYKLRRDFILIGLTGRTGSGCSSVAKILSTKDFNSLKTEFREINTEPWDNDSRKNRIVHNYMQKHWHAFTVIQASDIIFYYALQLNFKDFIEEFSSFSPKYADKEDAEIYNAIKNNLEKDYEELHNKVIKCEQFIYNKDADKLGDITIDSCFDIISKDIPAFREKLSNVLHPTKMRIYSSVLQRWGNNIRIYDSVRELEDSDINENAPACLACKINQFIKLKRKKNRNSEEYTHIVIDALRNPYEVLYFRERYAAFYLMSINTEEKIRRDKLIEKGYNLDLIADLDKKESDKKDFSHSYQEIDINKCIDLSDIYITHDGTECKENRKLNNQIITYLALIRHPGLIPPSPLERVMQIAYTAKLNSGCLSRQVGAVVTNENYSVQSIGWNTVAEGQTPCSLRCLNDLLNSEDKSAYSEFEKTNPKFNDSAQDLLTEYNRKLKNNPLLGLPLAYCFKDIHTSTADKQLYNQVHTRALHAEENAFLQLSKYGTQGIQGGKLFTTSSCCELCGKKAYQLGIREIYYIDSYPGITQKHIIECGDKQPKMILFHGAIGRAYSNLYNPLLPLKDEVEALSNVSVKDFFIIKDNGQKTQSNKELP
jgi:deoxycytidylate deaminase